MVLQAKSSVILFLIGCAGLFACSNENTISTVSLEDADLLPSIHGEKIKALISDSGITRYRLTTDVWDMYPDIPDPYWYFPEQIYFEILDTLFQRETDIKADTAYYFEKKNLWQLKGNVLVQNRNGEKFSTSELFWDSQKPDNSMESIHSDSLVRIETGNSTVISRGIRANRSMTKYRFYDNRIEMKIEEDAANQPDSTQITPPEP
ncbi:MAG: LPS export ABC transporter periplasmic protein LptC [Candidatus Symbiothrix sp.]|nr:LPS export ABC transporter periplasmic protein LptC [Candidatus Symbiothrix sp.]